MKIELTVLEANYGKLWDYIQEPAFFNMNQIGRNLMYRQRNAMAAYLEVLSERINAAEIERAHVPNEATQAAMREFDSDIPIEGDIHFTGLLPFI